MASLETKREWVVSRCGSRRLPILRLLYFSWTECQRTETREVFQTPSPTYSSGRQDEWTIRSCSLNINLFKEFIQEGRGLPPNGNQTASWTAGVLLEIPLTRRWTTPREIEHVSPALNNAALLLVSIIYKRKNKVDIKKPKCYEIIIWNEVFFPTFCQPYRSIQLER